MRISDWSSDVCSSDLDQAAMPSPPARSSRRSLLPKRAAAIACHRPCALPTCAYEKGPLLTVSASRSARGRQFHTFEPRWGLTPRIPLPDEEIGRASCRERVCQYVKTSVVAGTLQTNKNSNKLVAKS